MDIPARSRGKAYKVQYRDPVSLSWMDVQKRHTDRGSAVTAAQQYAKAHTVEVRLMELDLDSGRRMPVALS